MVIQSVKQKYLYKDRIGAGLVLLLKGCVSVCPGDEGHPPVVPLLRLGPHLSRPLAPLPAHGATGEDEEAGMEGVHAHGRDGAPDLTPGVEEVTEGVDLGGDMTGHNLDPMTETESETETETEKGTGDGTLHADGQGMTSSCFLSVPLFYSVHSNKLSYLLFPGPVPAHGRGAHRGEGVGTAEAAVPLVLPAVPTTVPLLLTEEPSPLPSLSLTS